MEMQIREFGRVWLEEFSSTYVLNLRGNARTSGERQAFGRRQRLRSGVSTGAGGYHNLGLRTRTRGHTKSVRIHYRDIGDYLSREQKLEDAEGD